MRFSMKNILFFVLLVALYGCTGGEENASSNLKKGDEFFEKEEYEVAEYYYEKVPEESPLYSKAKRKLDEIAVIKRLWVEKDVPETEVARIQILNHRYAVDNVRHVPSHSLELYNNLPQNVEYVDLEFTYLDQEGTVITTLTMQLRTSIFPNSRKGFNAVEPGYVGKSFATSEAKIVRARYN
jgi:hypothetical protein